MSDKINGWPWSSGKSWARNALVLGSCRVSYFVHFMDRLHGNGRSSLGPTFAWNLRDGTAITKADTPLLEIEWMTYLGG